jgi:hypothetical protein
MHLYGLVRAEKRRLDRWIEDLSAQYFPIKIIDPYTKKIEQMHVQIAVRKVELLEIVFPKESYAEAMTVINPHGQIGGFTKFINKVYMFLGLNKVLNKKKWLPTNKMVDSTNIEFIAIGTKDDLMVPLIETTPQAEEQL